jgi:hypothetical protein
MSKPGYEGVLERYDAMKVEKVSWFEAREWLLVIIEWEKRWENRTAALVAAIAEVAEDPDHYLGPEPETQK